MIELRISEAAALAIVEQSDYYRQVSDFALAERWESAVDEAAHSLMNWPERGTSCRFKTPELAGLRWIFIPEFPKHLLFYRYLPLQQSILIVHVLQGARNLETLLDEDG